MVEKWTQTTDIPTYTTPSYGWKCPCCGAVYSPMVTYCPRCTCSYPMPGFPGTGPVPTFDPYKITCRCMA